jgi:hypothetical protein
MMAGPNDARVGVLPLSCQVTVCFDPPFQVVEATGSVTCDPLVRGRVGTKIRDTYENVAKSRSCKGKNNSKLSEHCEEFLKSG